MTSESIRYGHREPRAPKTGVPGAVHIRGRRRECPRGRPTFRKRQTATYGLLTGGGLLGDGALRPGCLPWSFTSSSGLKTPSSYFGSDGHNVRRGNSRIPGRPTGTRPAVRLRPHEHLAAKLVANGDRRWPRSSWDAVSVSTEAVCAVFVLVEPRPPTAVEDVGRQASALSSQALPDSVRRCEHLNMATLSFCATSRLLARAARTKPIPSPRP